MRIREADLARDRTAFLTFIMGSQHFEYAIEPNRRLDSQVAAEHLERLLAHLKDHDGRMFVADDETGVPVGWAVVGVVKGEAFVVPEERDYAYVFELFVAEAVRGQGVGRALIAACETWARSKNFKTIQIGVLAGNTRAAKIYREAGYSDYAIELLKYLR
ncbi:MAG TPA: GNAT family N-acetyltransferase [Rhizomicrobium sp.]|nr:GNAT family N-acetyltransferase [Rhizomicrobium sp.]